MIFLDTSAIFALADENDQNHKEAKNKFKRALSQKREFLLHSYILVEAGALMQRRLGLKQAKTFLQEARNFHIVWVDSSLHGVAENYFHERATRRLSFVDCVSFVLMRQENIVEAFAFDDDFEKAGFRSL